MVSNVGIIGRKRVVMEGNENCDPNSHSSKRSKQSENLKVVKVNAANQVVIHEQFENFKLKIKFGWSSLCNEVIEHIFSFLDPHELSSMLFVSCQTRTIASYILSKPIYHFPFLKRLVTITGELHRDYHIKANNRVITPKTIESFSLDNINKETRESIRAMYLVMHLFRSQIREKSLQVSFSPGFERFPTINELVLSEKNILFLAKKTQLCLGILFTPQGLLVDLNFQQKQEPYECLATYSFNQAAKFHLPGSVFEVLNIQKAAIYSTFPHITLNYVLANSQRQEVLPVIEDRFITINNSSNHTNNLYTLIKHSFQPSDLAEILDWLLKKGALPCETEKYSTHRLILRRGEVFKKEFVAIAAKYFNKSDSPYYNWWKSLISANADDFVQPVKRKAATISFCKRPY